MATAIDRFTLIRNLDLEPWRKKVLDSYLSLGGLTTQTTLPDSEIDFVYVLRIFLSSLTSILGPGPSIRIVEGCEVLGNFLRYILYHSVIPEFQDQIKEGIVLLHQASEELSRLNDFARSGLGDFNSSCSIVFGGWLAGLSDPGWCESPITLTVPKAHEILAPISGLLGSKAVRSEMLPVTVLSITPAEHQDGMCEMSEIDLEVWRDIEGAYEDDQVETDINTLTIHLEFDISKNLYVGAHFEAQFYELSNGIWFFDQLMRTAPSFYIEQPDPVDE